MTMKRLTTYQIIKISGGANDNHVQCENNLLAATIYMPPHLEDKFLNVSLLIDGHSLIKENLNFTQ
jgi:hypothetical protein